MKHRSLRGSRFARNLVSLAIALGVAVGCYLGFLVDEHFGHLLTNIEAKVVDLRFRLRGPLQPSGEVVVVAIDSKSTERIGRWPWSRSEQAALVDRLRQWGASTVIFDVLFSEPEGVEEIRRLRRIAAALPADDDGASAGQKDPVRSAIEAELSRVRGDELFAAAMERTFDDDAALVVLAFDFVFEEELAGQVRHLGKPLSGGEEQIVLDTAAYMSRDENMPFLRNEPPKLALGIRPVITSLAEWSAALGFVDPVRDADGAVRRERLLVVYSPSVREASEAGRNVRDALLDPEARVQAYMSLAVAGVATHLRLGIDQVILDMAASEVRFETRGETPAGVRVHRFDPYDGTTRIDYYGPAGTFPTYSFVDVLRDELSDGDGHHVSGREAFEGKMVFVGWTDPGLRDNVVMPFTAILPGVEKHANVAENLLTGRHLRRHADYELAVGLSVLGAAVVVAVIAANSSALVAGFLLTALTMTWLWKGYADFVYQDLVWNWTLPLLTLTFSYAAVTSYRSATERRAKRAMLERSRFIQETFGRYLSDEVVAQMVETPEALRLGGERRELTIMMSDLRGFSALCERSSPEVVIGLLNRYLATMTDIIFRHGGTIDEFIGDAILALFGAPVAREDDAQRAVACAIEMQLAMPEVNRRLVEEGFPELEMGIALNTGEVIVGNIGSERRAKYGVVGANVNLTGRIESVTVGGQIFVSQRTLLEAGDGVETGARIDVRAKGFSDPVAAYEILGIGPPYNLRIQEPEEELVDLPVPIPVELTALEGKHFSDTVRSGSLVRLSFIGGDLRCDLSLEPLVNIKLALRGPGTSAFKGDVYAKVVERRAADGCCALRFTWTPSEVKDYFRGVIKSAATD